MERLIVESLRRLYLSEKITKNKINELLGKGIINKEEHIYILSDVETEQNE